MGRVRVHCYACGDTVQVDERWPTQGLEIANWALARGETFCTACARERGFEVRAERQEVNGPRVRIGRDVEISVPSGPALGDERTARAFARYRSRGWLWIVAGVALLSVLLAVGAPAMPRQGQVQGLARFWIEGLVIGVGFIFGGFVVFRRARRWRQVLGRTPWQACGSRYIAIPPRAGRSGMELTSVDGDETAPALFALAPGLRNRDRLLAGQQTLWVAGPLTGDVILALPGSLDLFAARPPRGRARRRLLAARANHGAGGSHTRRRKWRVALTVAVAGLQVPLLVMAATKRPPGPDGPIPSPTGASTYLVSPTPGPWVAHGTILTSIGSNEPVGETLMRGWSIYRACGGGVCSYYVQRETATTPLTARLQARGTLWYAEFPPQTNTCGVSASGDAIYWQSRTRFLLRFSADGRTLSAGERNSSSAPDCGYGLTTATWIATRATTAPG